MPFTIEDVEKHTSKATSDEEKKQWVEVANSALEACLADGGTDEVCGPSAIKQANGVIAKAKAEDEEEEPEEEETAEVELQESANPNVQFIEADGKAGRPERAPLKLQVRLIRPGPGNAQHKHYYPRDVLKRDARMFEGVKMYATDHRDEEKSVRTEVSTVDKIVGFDEDGAPLAQVTVFDPDFAEQVRNRAAAGKLDTLECSILAAGRAKSTMVEGERYNVVEAITSARSVDWVTKAGAGGAAVNLMEKGDPAPADDIVILSEAEVQAVLAEAHLPDDAKAWLAETQYKDEDAVKAAVNRLAAIITETDRSGVPVTGRPRPHAEPKRATLAEIQEAQQSVNARWLGARKSK